MRRSQLVYRILAPQQPERATIIPLHGYNGAHQDLIPLARSLGPQVRIIAPEALSGVFQGRLTTGHMWYRIQELGYPEPASFGDSLWQLEQFIYDLLKDRQGAIRTRIPRPVFLLGYDQGAVLALTLSLVIPEYLSGVIAIRGYLPDMQGWPIEMQEMNNFPVLLISDPRDAGFPRSLTDETIRQLSAHGAHVSVRHVPDAHMLAAGVGQVLHRWLHSDGVLDRDPRDRGEHD
jgi:phospholipase/carboxylesterase